MPLLASPIPPWPRWLFCRAVCPGCFRRKVDGSEAVSVLIPWPGSRIILVVHVIFHQFWLGFSSGRWQALELKPQGSRSPRQPKQPVFWREKAAANVGTHDFKHSDFGFYSHFFLETKSGKLGWILRVGLPRKGYSKRGTGKTSCNCERGFPSQHDAWAIRR